MLTGSDSPLAGTAATEAGQRGRLAAQAGVILLVLLACAVRFVHLDADPVFPTWVAYIVDEGRWVESARNMALFGHADAFADRIHLMLSPAYQLCSYLVFKWQGVSFVSARAAAALAGSAMVVIVAICLRRHVTLAALTLGTVILGFETNMLVESRLALPEIPAAFATLVSALVLMLARQTRRNAVIAGLLLTLALAFKGTVALVAPALFVIPLLPSEQLSWRDRIGRTLAFSAGVGVVVVAGLVAGIAAQVITIDKLQHMGGRLLTFISLADPGNAIWAFFNSQAHAVRNVLLLGAWFGSWIWFHRAPGPLTPAGRVYLASAVWAGWSLVVWAANAYSPGRYLIHLIVPATIHLMVGFSLGDRLTLSRIQDRFKRCEDVAHIASLTWLVLPAAIIVSSQLVGLAGLLGWEIVRTGDRAALIAASTLSLSLVVHRCRAGGRAATMCLLAPVTAVLLWCLGWEFELFRHFWEYQSPDAIRLWLLAGSLALAGSALHAHSCTAPRNTLATQLAMLVVVAMPLIFRATLPLRAPTFTIRDASRDIGLLLPTLTTGEIRVHSASSLFLENGLRYRELPSSSMDFEWLVVFEHNQSVQRLLHSIDRRDVESVRTYPLTIDSRYQFESAIHGRPQVTLLHRRPAQPASAPGGAAR